jgi:capsule polysaccharide modification protein KpsS
MGLMESIPMKDSNNYLMVGACLMELPQGGYLMPRTALWLVNPDGVVAFAHLPVDPKNFLKAPELLQIIRQEQAKANLKSP